GDRGEAAPVRPTALHQRAREGTGPRALDLARRGHAACLAAGVRDPLPAGGAGGGPGSAPVDGGRCRTDLRAGCPGGRARLVRICTFVDYSVRMMASRCRVGYRCHLDETSREAPAREAAMRRRESM